MSSWQPDAKPEQDTMGLSLEQTAQMNKQMLQTSNMNSLSEQVRPSELTPLAEQVLVWQIGADRLAES